MTMKTFRLSGHAIDRQWHVLDAAGRPLGRVASEAAQLLLGKHKATYEPHLAMGDHVVVINASQVDLTGAKREQKVYYRHTGYPGGLRSRSFTEQMERDPRRVIERAVKGMLPHNARGRQLFRALKVYAGPDHPHEAQLKAGTGARAHKRARAAEAAASAAVAAAAAEARTAEAEAAEAAASAADVETPAVPAAVPAPEVVVEETAPDESVTDETPAAEAEVETAGHETADAPEADAVDEPDEAEARLAAPLAERSREELDAEAARLGLEVQDGDDDGAVAQAIQQHYDANSVEE